MEKHYISVKNYSLILCSFCITIISNQIHAQQSPVFSQYMFNGLAINPAYAGNQQQLSATALYRKQWDNLVGAPTTKTLSVHSGIKNKNIGVGLLAANDQIGVHNETRVYMSYAYKIKMSVGTLAMGLQAGFNNLYSDFTKLNVKSDNDVLLAGTARSFKPNFGTGLFFSTSTAFVGFSIPYIINSKLNRAEDIIKQGMEARYYFLTAGVVFPINQYLKIKPTTLVRVQEGNAMNIDLNMNMILDDLVTVGMSYRSNDAIIGLLEMQLTETFRLGYAYDYNISEIGQYANGSHEFMINFRIPQSQKCHTYF